MTSTSEPSYTHFSQVKPTDLSPGAMAPMEAQEFAECFGLDAFLYSGDGHWHGLDKDGEFRPLDLTDSWDAIWSMLLRQGARLRNEKLIQAGMADEVMEESDDGKSDG
jgi:hypothetical protein